MVMATMSAVNLGPMCRNDFKVSEGAVVVCGVVADFAAPPLVRELLRKASLRTCSPASRQTL